MRYYNENPQVIALLEKIEEQERRIEVLQGKINIANEMCDECVKFSKRFNMMP